MKHLLYKQKKYRKNFFATSKKYYFLKAMVNVGDLPLPQRVKVTKDLLKYKNTQTKIRNRCIYTSRGRSVFTDSKLSRIIFREKAAFGHLLGIRKSSW